VLKFLEFKNIFLRETGLMFIGISFFNLSHLLYYLFMMRNLSLVEYGHLNTLVALFTVVSIPAGTVQTTVTRFFSSFKVQNQYHQAIELLRHFLLLMSIIAVFFFLLVIFTSSQIASFLQISSRGSIILFGLCLIFAMVNPVPWGGLQGLQKFGLLTLNLVINGGLKFALGALFVFLGFGLLGAIGAIALSYFVTTFLSLFIVGVSLLRAREAAGQAEFPKDSNSSSFSEVYHYFFFVGSVLLCFMILTNIDLIFAKHFFTPVEAGYYSVAQMAGKIILFLPLPIIMVMFPKLFSLEAQGKGGLITLGKSLAIAGFLCGGASLLSLLFPSLIVKILSGKPYSECSPLVGLFAINMALFSLTLILLHYHLSTRERGFLYSLFFFTLTEVALIILFHDTLIQVLLVVGIVAFCLFGINLYLAYHPHRRDRKIKDSTARSKTLNEAV
jgi:O-antigen/teichoic acid export membrane protein